MMWFWYGLLDLRCEVSIRPAGGNGRFECVLLVFFFGSGFSCLSTLR